MNKKVDKAKITLSIPAKINKLFRLQAFKSELELSELFCEYQQAYLWKLKQDKAKKKE